MPHVGADHFWLPKSKISSDCQNLGPPPIVLNLAGNPLLSSGKNSHVTQLCLFRIQFHKFKRIKALLLFFFNYSDS